MIDHFLENLILQVHELDLSPSFQNERFRVMENLDRFVHLAKLSLSGNMISKIENISKLVNLREFIIKDNLLTKIDQIEALRKLEVLDVSGNQIERLPPRRIFEKLKHLTTIKADRNKLSIVCS
jgi:protein phosphatase 1 regulatory subunit 7